MHISSPRFVTAITVEAYKLQRSLALLLAALAPLLIAVFIFFSLLRQDRVMSWEASLQVSLAIWAFFMLPMSVTALTALIAHTEHGPRAWDHLRALPLPRWHLYAAKAVCTLGVVAAMSVTVGLLTLVAVTVAGWVKPETAVSGVPDLAVYVHMLGRIFLSSWFVVAVQLWIALRFASFVPALGIGIGGTFFAVVATAAEIGAVLPWQIPVNQLAPDPARSGLALLVGFVGGCAVLAMMVWHLGRREVR
jgi:lantibiotic transport system permease protein